MPRLTIASLGVRANAAPPRLGETRLVLIDGQAGAGKTTLAARVAAELHAPLLHTDDMLAGWDGLSGVGASVSALLAPLARGEAGTYRRWDWEAGQFAETVTVEPATHLVIEGVGCASRAARQHASLVVFVEAPWDVRLARALERDKGRYEDVEGNWTRFEQDQNVVHVAEGTREAADIVIDGTLPIDDGEGAPPPRVLP